MIKINVITNNTAWLNFIKNPINYIDHRISKINSLYDEGHTIIYWTARGTMSNINWFKITQEQLTSWECKYHELRMNKPAYDLFIDDKNVESKTYFNS